MTMPLMIFLVLGTIQLFMMVQGRAMAHYAAARAARAGSLNYGDCDAIRHTAVAALLPTFTTARTPLELADAFALRKDGYYDGARDGHNEPIFWLIRESPTPRRDEEELFDLGSTRPSTMVLRIVFFYPLRIPFANWVISTIIRANYRLENLSGADPLLPMRANGADWSGTGTIAANIGAELVDRAKRKHYVAPIQVSYSMRMMTPARLSHFPRKECAPYP